MLQTCYIYNLTGCPQYVDLKELSQLSSATMDNQPSKTVSDATKINRISTMPLEVKGEILLHYLEIVVIRNASIASRGWGGQHDKQALDDLGADIAPFVRPNSLALECLIRVKELRPIYQQKALGECIGDKVVNLSWDALRLLEDFLTCEEKMASGKSSTCECKGIPDVPGVFSDDWSWGQSEDELDQTYQIGLWHGLPKEKHDNSVKQETIGSEAECVDTKDKTKKCRT